MFKTTNQPFYFPEEAAVGGLAAALAKSGTRTEEGMSAELPPVHIEPKVEAKEAEKPPVETTTTDSNASEAKAEAAQPEVKSEDTSPKPATKGVTDKEETPPINLQEVLKNHQPDAVLKELGFDEGQIAFAKEYAALPKEMQGFLQHWKSKGDVKEYLQQLTTDYATMQPEDVMRHQLKREYPEMSESELEDLYQIKVVNRYKLDPDVYTDREVEMGRIELKADVKSIRGQLSEEQKKFLIPSPPEVESGPDPQEQQRQLVDSVVSGIKQSKTYLDIVQGGGRLKVGSGDDAFNFPVEPDALIDVLYNPNSFADAMLAVQKGADGKEVIAPKDIEHQMLVGAVIKYGKKFLDEYAAHQKALGALSAVGPIDNVVPPSNNSPVPVEPESNSLAGKMAKMGRRVTSN